MTQEPVMSATIWATLLAAAMMLVLAGLGLCFRYVKQSYYFGVTLWAHWLPVAATAVYLGVLAINILWGTTVGDRSLSLCGFLSYPEMMVLFLAGPLFLTSAGNVLGAATLVYCSERLVLGDAHLNPTLGLLLLIAAATVVAVLGDKMPWLVRTRAWVAPKLREVMLLGLSFASLGVVFAAIIKVYAFSRWLGATFDVNLTPAEAMVALLGLFIGWLSIALGVTRHFVLPLLCLPSLFVLAYLTRWPSYLLVVPFTACLALSLAAAERRDLPRADQAFRF